VRHQDRMLCASITCMIRHYVRSDGVPHEPRAQLMVTARRQAYAALGHEDLSPCDGTIARLPTLSCGLRGL